jgi:hypothetical protein
VPLALDPAYETVSVIEDGVATVIPLAGGRGTLPGATRVGIRELRDGDGASLGRVAANLFSTDESDVRLARDQLRRRPRRSAARSGRNRGHPDRSP